MWGLVVHGYYVQVQLVHIAVDFMFFMFCCMPTASSVVLSTSGAVSVRSRMCNGYFTIASQCIIVIAVNPDFCRLINVWSLASQ